MHIGGVQVLINDPYNKTMKILDFDRSQILRPSIICTYAVF